MVSEPMPQLLSNTQRFRTQRVSFWSRLSFMAVALIMIGWLWPYGLSELPSYLDNTGWLLGWFTVLVLIGTACGSMLRSRWSAFVVPLMLYTGGVIHWMQHEHGLQTPPWPMFGIVSGLALGVLLITAGAAAGIASRVVVAEAEGRRPAEGIRHSAALAALLGLIAITSIQVLPTPFLGALLGLGALLAGMGLMEEDQVNFRERVLAISGMLIGVVAVSTQLYSLWSFIKDL